MEGCFQECSFNRISWKRKGRCLSIVCLFPDFLPAFDLKSRISVDFLSKIIEFLNNPGNMLPGNRDTKAILEALFQTNNNPKNFGMILEPGIGLYLKQCDNRTHLNRTGTLPKQSNQENYYCVSFLGQHIAYPIYKRGLSYR